MRRAVRLEWLTLAYLLSAVFFIYLTLGASQAMKTAWFEDIPSLIPPAVFLVASRYRHRDPDGRFPYGFHRVVTIAFLCAAVALFAMGAFLLWDSVTALLSFEHPSIGTVRLFGTPIWLGWLMLPALVWSAANVRRGLCRQAPAPDAQRLDALDSGEPILGRRDSRGGHRPGR